MPEPLKNLYNTALIENLSTKINDQYPHFDSHGFSAYVMDDDWENKELKARMRHISIALHHYLPMPYAKVIALFTSIAPSCHGFQYMLFPDYVECYGLDEYATSIHALEHFTACSSSEFAVRPFIQKYPEQMMQQMTQWASSDNHHVRRLASEGCRPRLPWAMALPRFKQDPAPILPILEKLCDDPSEYVRRSVANNLNDISKDNPDLVIQIAKRWLGRGAQTDWVVKHACRSLLKQGQPEIMALFGLLKPEHISIEGFTVQASVEIGDKLDFSFSLVSPQKLGKLRLEYAVGFMKKNGTLSKKVFQISASENSSHHKSITKRHNFKRISTRIYYTGKHSIHIIVNGHTLASAPFLLTEKASICTDDSNL